MEFAGSGRVQPDVCRTLIYFQCLTDVNYELKFSFCGLNIECYMGHDNKASHCSCLINDEVDDPNVDVCKNIVEKTVYRGCDTRKTLCNR